MMEVTKVLTSVFALCLSGSTFGYPFTHNNLFSATGGNVGPRTQQAQQELPTHLEDYLSNRGGQQQPQQLPTHLEDYLATRGAQQQGQHQLPAHLENYLANRGSQEQGQQVVPSHLEDYLANYVQGARQYQPQYQPASAYDQGYIAQVPQSKLTAETLAALLPYLSSSSNSLNSGSAAAAAGSSDYVYPDYPAAAAAPAYQDDDGTWYDDMAQQQLYNNEPMQQDEEQVVLQLLLDHLNGRYSLDDLAALEREAELEENTESQLQSLMSKKMVKKSTFPALGGRSGQKEEAPLMPATSVRRPVWGQQQQSGNGEASNMNTEVKRSSDVQEAMSADTVQGSSDNKITDSSSISSSSSSSSTPASTSSSTTTITSADDSSNSAADSSSADSVTQVEETTMTPRLQNAYDALKKYLDRERKFRQEQDDLTEMSELTEPSRGIQKRFAPDEDSLSQQLVNLKKNHS